MEEFTKEQKAQLKTWAEQRDELLLMIQNLRVEQEKLQVLNKELANANSDIEARMNVIKGRIEELSLKEKEYISLIPKELSLLESKKTLLESELNLLQKTINALVPQKASLETDIEKALSVFNIVKGETLLLDQVVDRVTSVSKKNQERIDLLVHNLAKSLEEIIEVNRKNVFETNIVIDKVPKMIMEAQKHGLIKNKI